MNAPQCRTRTLAAALLLVVALAGCTSTPESPAPTPTGGSAPTATASDEVREPFADPSAISEQEPSGDAMLTVTDVRVAAHDDYDRVVFDLGGTGTPGWRVEYVDESVDDGSGLPVQVAGDAVLQVRVSGTGMPADTGIEEFAGDVVGLDGESIEQVVYRFVFEGYSTAFVGTSGRAPFRVLSLSDPTRLVIDVQHR